MDGLPTTLMPLALPPSTFSVDLSVAQRTLKASIDCVGIGLHSGAVVAMTLCPASVGTGIVFRRVDLAGAPMIPATYDRVMDTTLCTVLGDPDWPELRIGTIEHVMAALTGLGISNAVIEVDGPELPILDGSAAGFVFLIGCAGVVEQDEPAPVIEVLRPVRVEHVSGFAELRPADQGLDLAISIAFEAAAIGRQALSLRLSADAFRHELADARTFTQLHEVEKLRATGLARGGSLANAVLVDGPRILNPGGLRTPDEFVRHKMLDAVGDLGLAGAALHGRFVGHCSGHALNNAVLRALFAESGNWRKVSPGAWGRKALAAAA